MPIEWTASSAFKIGFALYDIEGGKNETVSIPVKEDPSSTKQTIKADSLKYSNDYRVVVNVQRTGTDNSTDAALKQVVVNDETFTTGN